MKLHQWLWVFVVAWVMGCQAPINPEPVAAPATPDQVEHIRETLRAQKPQIEVGVVMDTLTSEMLAAVGDVDVVRFKEGDVICFMDSKMDPLGCGKIVRITDTQIHVRYEKPVGSRREPARGDLAVAFQ